jgi:hypothetical protein
MNLHRPLTFSPPRRSSGPDGSLFHSHLEVAQTIELLRGGVDAGGAGASRARGLTRDPSACMALGVEGACHFLAELALRGVSAETCADAGIAMARILQVDLESVKRAATAPPPSSSPPPAHAATRAFPSATSNVWPALLFTAADPRAGDEARAAAVGAIVRVAWDSRVSREVCTLATFQALVAVVQARRAAAVMFRVGGGAANRANGTLLCGAIRAVVGLLGAGSVEDAEAAAVLAMRAGAVQPLVQALEAAAGVFDTTVLVAVAMYRLAISETVRDALAVAGAVEALTRSFGASTGPEERVACIVALIRLRGAERARDLVVPPFALTELLCVLEDTAARAELGRVSYASPSSPRRYDRLAAGVATVRPAPAETEDPLGGPALLGCTDLANTLHSIALNDDNRAKLVDVGAARVAWRMMVSSGRGRPGQDIRAERAAAAALWSLSLSPFGCEELLKTPGLREQMARIAEELEAGHPSAEFAAGILAHVRSHELSTSVARPEPRWAASMTSEILDRSDNLSEFVTRRAPISPIRASADRSGLVLGASGSPSAASPPPSVSGPVSVSVSARPGGAVTWTPLQVCEWLMNNGFNSFSETFFAHSISGRSLFELAKLYQVNPQAFFTVLSQQLGVVSAGHQLDLANKVLELFEV